MRVNARAASTASGALATTEGRYQVFEPNVQRSSPFLTEPLLGDFLRVRVDPNVIADQEMPGLKRRFRPERLIPLSQGTPYDV